MNEIEDEIVLSLGARRMDLWKKDVENICTQISLKHAVTLL